MSLDFDQPITRRAADQADDAPALLLALAETLRTLNAEQTYLLSIVTDTSRDLGRRIYLAEAQGRTALETAGRAQQAVERLTRSLRAAGRL
jgi:hypothetical protein